MWIGERGEKDKRWGDFCDISAIVSNCEGGRRKHVGAGGAGKTGGDL